MTKIVKGIDIKLVVSPLPESYRRRVPGSMGTKLYIQLKDMLKAKEVFKKDPDNADIDFSFFQEARSQTEARAIQQTMFNEANRLGWVSNRKESMDRASRSTKRKADEEEKKVVYFTNVVPTGDPDRWLVYMTLP